MSRRGSARLGALQKTSAVRQPAVFSREALAGPSFSKVDVLLRRKYERLIARHLDRLLKRLVAEFTGLPIRLSWSPVWDHAWEAQNPSSGCPMSSCLLPAEGPAKAHCRACWQHHLGATLKSAGGQYFTCGIGLRNFWSPVRVRGVTLGLACLQAPKRLDCRPFVRHRAARPVCGFLTGPATERQRVAQTRARRMGRSDFAQVARFLRFVIEHAQTASLADLLKDDLAKAMQALRAFEKAQTRLRTQLSNALPALRKSPPTMEPESRPEQIVRRILSSMESDYGKPVTLRSYAREFGMNTAYLSALFSRVIGLPFKTYLTELRLEKASELLGDPAWSASQVAYAVGYSSENRFRSAFKKATGLSPRLWRETLRIRPTMTPA
jgi:AraC-like DNA-binding protein